MIFKQKIRNKLFVAFGVLSAMTALYHFISIFYNLDLAPIWRHLVFVGVNLFCIFGFLKRPGYFVYFLAILLVQQYYSHGSYMVSLWCQRGQIHWISVFDLLLLPVALICVIEDRKIKIVK